jgi:uncharacterized protein (TIGR02117 family)
MLKKVNIMQIIHFLLFLICSPIFLIYLIFCLIIPLIKIGQIKKEKGLKIYIIKDLIHSDYIFESKNLQEIFETQKKYIKIGWGDRKIFLETKNWNELKLIDFITAFFGLNKTVLRIEHLEELPTKFRQIEISENQLQIIKKHIKDSHNNKLIQKKKEYYQIGDYYESDLKYNCIKTCNNWVNLGLRKSSCSNRIWCPISFWL